MSHAIVGVLTCATIHSIELDRMSRSPLYTSHLSHTTSTSRRRRLHKHVGRNTLAHPPSGLPRFLFHWRVLDRLRFQHRREQNRLIRTCGFLSVHPLVGEAEPAVSPYYVSWIESLTPIFNGHRTWGLILGMTGLIILFWFVAGGAALRYLASSSSTTNRNGSNHNLNRTRSSSSE